jgi:hypothetical protein
MSMGDNNEEGNGLVGRERDEKRSEELGYLAFSWQGAQIRHHRVHLCYHVHTSMVHDWAATVSFLGVATAPLSKLGNEHRLLETPMYDQTQTV